MFIKSKVYYLLTTSGREIKKFAGQKCNQITREHYRKLHRGESVEVENTRIFRNVLSCNGLVEMKHKALLTPLKYESSPRTLIYGVNSG